MVNLNDTLDQFNSKFPVSFKLITAIPISKDPGKVLIKWELEKTSINLKDFEFYIDRGDSPDQVPAFQHKTIDGKTWKQWSSENTDSVNMTQIGGPINGLDFYEFVDYTPLLRNLWKIYYYRVRVRRISTQDEMGSAPITWKGDLDLEGLYVVDEHNFLLEDTTGVPCLVYPRKRGGIACTECFDPIQKKRLSSSCQTCYGTNWVGGFFNPIDVFIDLNPTTDQTSIQQWGETQETETDLLLTNYPMLSSGDLIRELRPNRLWRVVRTKDTEKRRSPMLQLVRVIEVKPGDVEYKIPVDQAFIEDKITKFEEYKKRREF